MHKALEELKKDFEESGFELMRSETTIASEYDLKDYVALTSLYGIAVVVYVPENDNLLSQNIQALKSKAQSYINDELIKLENNRGLIVDGYLVLVLPRQPNDTERSVVRDVETDSRVCRKNVVWLSEDGKEIERKQYITVLALPAPLSSSKNAVDGFELSAEMQSLLHEYSKLRSLDKVVDYIKAGGLSHVD